MFGRADRPDISTTCLVELFEDHTKESPMTANRITSTRPRTSAARYRLVVVLIATVAAIAVWLITNLVGARLEVSSPLIRNLNISLLLVIVTTVPVAFAAWGLLALLERRVKNGARTWRIVAVVILAVFVLSVLFLVATPETKVCLELLHLTVGLTLTIMLPRRSQSVKSETAGE